MTRLQQHYQQMLRAKHLQADAAQRQVLKHLSQLESALTPPVFWSRFRRVPPRSLYIHGGVGGGKSMLMDLFYTHCAVEKKWRVHFHAFMQHVHERLAQLRQQTSRAKERPLPRLTRALSQEVRLLCFDEFHVNNIADAALLHRLFRQLLAHGVVFVTTSNDAPQELYRGGLQRERFVPFIKLVEETCDICALQARQDYRRQEGATAGHWFVARDAGTRRAFESCVRSLFAPHQPQPGSLCGKGQALFFDQLVPGAARISYDKLCGLPLGARDYLLLARHLHSLVLDDVPQLGPPRLDAAHRFITLLDILYEHRLRLVASSQSALEELWQPLLNAPQTAPRQKQAVLRAQSRLQQMSRPDWGRARTNGAAAG